MADDKDRLGDKLRDKERGEEGKFFAERDRAAIEKLRKQAAAVDQDRLAELTRNRCPKCGARLQAVEHRGVTVEECPHRHGMWLDTGELETIANRERDSWLGRLFFRPPR